MPVGPGLDDALRAACAGDESGFEALYRNVQPRLLRYLRTVVGADAEDVASETWLQVARDLHTFQGDVDGFRGWVATIGRHRGLDLIRARGCRPLLADAELSDSMLVVPGADDETLARLGTDRAVALIATLPREQAAAVLLRVVMGVDVTRTAQLLGRSPGSVRLSAHRGLRRLARQVAEQQEGGRQVVEQQALQRQVAEPAAVSPPPPARTRRTPWAVTRRPRGALS